MLDTVGEVAPFGHERDAETLVTNVRQERPLRGDLQVWLRNNLEWLDVQLRAGWTFAELASILRDATDTRDAPWITARRLSDEWSAARRWAAFEAVPARAANSNGSGPATRRKADAITGTDVPETSGGVGTHPKMIARRVEAARLREKRWELKAALRAERESLRPHPAPSSSKKRPSQQTRRPIRKSEASKIPVPLEQWNERHAHAVAEPSRWQLPQRVLDMQIYTVVDLFSASVRLRNLLRHGEVVEDTLRDFVRDPLGYLAAFAMRQGAGKVSAAELGAALFAFADAFGSGSGHVLCDTVQAGREGESPARAA